MPKEFLFFFILLHSMVVSNAQKDTLIYIGDPMCSWCYGFGPELEKLIKSNATLSLKIITGGLRPDGNENFIQLRDFLRSHWEEIHVRTGLPFKYDILNNQNLYYNTEPACRAIVSIRKLKPSIELDYFRALQNTFYAKNQNPVSLETFSNLATNFGIDGELFKKTFNSSETIHLTRQDFAMAQQLGVRGFPALLFKNAKGKVRTLSNGYSTFSDMQANLKMLLNSN
ncbi:MAG: DsbA family protein [Saprospiraceae bacterium]|nr:DsbA family protein [Saprospiraceae bacterium]